MSLRKLFKAVIKSTLRKMIKNKQGINFNFRKMDCIIQTFKKFVSDLEHGIKIIINELWSAHTVERRKGWVPPPPAPVARPLLLSVSAFHNSVNSNNWGRARWEGEQKSDCKLTHSLLNNPSSFDPLLIT